MKSRLPILFALTVVLMMGLIAEGRAEMLYNGIELPAQWPPSPTEIPDVQPTPPYLLSPPDVILIDVGRQLFVDGFLIESTTLTRTFHHAEYYPGNPILSPDKPWERGTTAPFSDGVWYDTADKLFKMWYMPGMLRDVAYAFSKDGIHWEKPVLDVVPGTNIVLQCGFRDSVTVWLDLNERNAAKRFKMILWDEDRSTGQNESTTTPPMASTGASRPSCCLMRAIGRRCSTTRSGGNGFGACATCRSRAGDDTGRRRILRRTPTGARSSMRPSGAARTSSTRRTRRSPKV